MSENNKLIVEMAKKILKEYGYEVKTSHLYELFSKLSGDKSYNVSSAKKTDFKKVIHPELYSIQDVSNLDQFIMGTLVEKELTIKKNFFLEPNALFVGSMGCGKSEAVNNVVLNYLLSNNHHSEIFLINTLKELSPYKEISKLKQVKSIVKEEDVINLINFLFEESNKRRDDFNLNSANDLINYENKSEKKISRLLVVIEEFSSFLNLINFDNEYKTINTAANKFYQLMRVGRSLGIWFIGITQKAMKTEINPLILSSFTNKFIFRVSKSESAYLMVDIKASELNLSQKGLCYCDEGLVRFELLSQTEQLRLISKIKSL